MYTRLHECLPLVLQVTKARSSYLPPSLLNLFYFIGLVQLRGIVLPPACTGYYPFAVEMLLMASAAAMFGATVAIYLRTKQEDASRFAGRITLTIAVMLYPAVANAAFDLMHCESVSMARSAASALDGGKTFLARLGGSESSVAVPLLANNPFFVCWEGNHKAAAYVAIAVLLSYSAGLPLVVLW